MSRLTSEPFRRKSDDSLENYKVRRINGEEWETSAQNAINKLGKLEDLMQEYNIKCIEELENLINSHKKQGEKIIDLSADLGMFQNENINLTKDIEKYWNLEEELRCPLEIIFKALKEDIIDIEGSRVSVSLEYIQASKEWLLIGKFCRTAYYVKDYQKTWWLKGEKDETCNGTD